MHTNVSKKVWSMAFNAINHQMSAAILMTIESKLNADGIKKNGPWCST